ncbi:uncharacterized protein A4U43_C10F5950 [Asparagus officinalis]|uniref:FHA domain-containing protein n=1 Tax=Asparagus officinalis TaxID=4686 RepID=A0A5P1E1B9_ASPOF|nr:myosin-16 isoform X2 [Asparagus officinalis]ONK56278.1 uncharacterized protein A4U43_C10F5950 [Asparagus officinalis]
MAVDSANEALNQEERSVSRPPDPKPIKNREDEIRQIARKFTDQPVQNSDIGAWGILTAISKLSRKRPQGMNITLSEDEHCFGRCVEDPCYRIDTISASSKHCTIFRARATEDGEPDSNISVPVFIKDTSTNGTYLNWTKLERSAKTRLQHGDIISFIHPPHAASAYAFVYREVSKSTGLTNGTGLKRKSDNFVGESKRHKGIGIGAPEGPISLDDVRSLQRSNTELRQQLESHVHTIETMRNENRATVTRHENEIKDLKEKVASSFLDQIKELHEDLDAKQKEIDECNTSLSELRRSIDDLKERLQLSNQSRADADEIIHSQKTTISELEAQLCEERHLRRGEREKAEAVLKSALQRAHSEAQEEIKRQTDVFSRQHKEQQEVINKLQEVEKESRLLVETLRSKLEDARENLSLSEKKVRQLEVQVQDEQAAFANSQRRSETLDAELKRLTKELESEKVAREEAWAKVSSLELEISAAIRDLSIEKQRFQGARERIILRETQLRAFYSTTEAISALFAKQQEQLKAMQKTLEDEENYANTLVGLDLNESVTCAVNAARLKLRDETQPENNTKEASGTSTPKNNHTSRESSDDGSTTEKHDCNLDENTQDLECTSSDRLANKGFVSDGNGIGTAVVGEGDPNDTERVLGTESQSDERTAVLHKCTIKGFVSDVDGVGTTVVNEEDPIDTERVLGTESQDAGFDERTGVLHKCSNLAGDTMQIDDEVQIQENLEVNTEDRVDPIRTADLLTSEVAGSWAVSTAPSVNGENETQDVDAAAALLLCSDGQASGSQSNVSGSKLSKEHKALNAMLEIVAPEFGQRFVSGDDDGKRNESLSDAETEKGSDNNDDDGHSDGGGGGGNDDDDDETDGDSAEGDNEVMIEDSEDSVG